jgi:hypothetical protein
MQIAIVAFVKLRTPPLPSVHDELSTRLYQIAFCTRSSFVGFSNRAGRIDDLRDELGTDYRVFRNDINADLSPRERLKPNSCPFTARVLMP